MQKTFTVVKLPLTNSDVTIEIPKRLVFDTYDEAFEAFVEIVESEENLLIPIERTKREEPIERFTGRSLIQIWICNIPEWDPEKLAQYGL